MSTLVVVADACVLVPAALCDLLLRSAAAGLLRLQWTDEILDEVRRTLVNDLGKSAEQARRRVEAMKDAFPKALISHHVPLIAAMTNDPKDRHVLAAAVASSAEVIVTSNLRDFPSKALAPFPVEAQSPDRFLVHLLDTDRDLIIEVLTQQAAALHHPPKTVRDILESLRGAMLPSSWRTSYRTSVPKRMPHPFSTSCSRPCGAPRARPSSGSTN